LSLAEDEITGIYDTGKAKAGSDFSVHFCL